MQLPFDPYYYFFQAAEKFSGTAYFSQAVIVGGVLLILVLFILVRRHIFNISMRGAFFGFLLGVILMILLDLIIVLGMADKAKIGKLLEKETRQEAISEVFISGVANLGHILGVSATTVPKTTKAQGVEEVIAGFLSLPEADAQKFKGLLCPP